MMPLAYSNLLRFVKTLSQRDLLYLEIEKISESLFREEPNALETAFLSIRPEIARVIKNELLNQINPTKQALKDFLDEIKKTLETLHPIKLSLAFSPSEKTIDHIYDWIGKNLGEGYVLDIKTDESLIGGVIVTFEGKYIDLSLKKTLDDVFLNKREEITQVIA